MSTTLGSLAMESDEALAEKMLGLIRNLSVGGSEAIDLLLNGTKESLVGILEKHLACLHEGSIVSFVRTSTRVTPLIRGQVNALYVICNVATGEDRHKATIMSSSLPESLLKLLSHDSADVRVASIWCVINLTWREVGV